MLNSKEIKEKLAKYSKREGWDTSDETLLEILTSEKVIYKELRSEHRWWDIWTNVILFDGVYIGFDYAQANRDMSVQDLGWEFEWDLWECEKKEITKIVYVPKGE